jgi:hypothetical protein
MPTDIDKWLREAVTAIKQGDKETGRDLLMRIIEEDDMHEQAWLWLSAAVEDREERIICLENVLTINPHNKAAQNGLKKLGVPLPASRAEPPPEPPPTGIPPAETGDLMGTYEDEPARDDDSWRQAVTAPTPSEEKSPVVERANKRAQKRQKRQQVLAAVPQGQDRDIMELFNAWVAALTFQERHLIAEMKAASPGRVMVNVLFALFIAGSLSAIAYIVALNQPLPPGMQEQVTDMFTQWEQSAGTPFPLTQAQLINVAFLIGAFSTVITVLINVVFFSVTTHIGARMLGGDGEFMQTAHAVTMAIVAQQIVGMVPTLVTTVLQAGTGIVGILLVLYNIAVAAVTLSAAHTEFGPVKAVASYIVGWLIGIIFLCVFGCVAVFALSFLTSVAG